LVKQLFLGVVHVVERLAWVYPGISIFSKFQEVFIGKVPVDCGTSIRLTESEAFGTGDELGIAMMCVFTVVCLSYVTRREVSRLSNIADSNSRYHLAST
jgi:hypothetical protein